MKLRVDSPVIQAGIKVTNLLILNLYWILGCVPLVTIGTSTIAAYTVCERLAEDREGVSMTRQFWGAYKANLGHGIALTLIFAAAGYAAWMNWQLFDKLGPERSTEVAVVTMDMAAPYIEEVKARAPNAEIAFDPFHVVKLANEAVQEVRRSEVRELNRQEDPAAQALKDARWSLLRGEESQTPM